MDTHDTDQPMPGRHVSQWIDTTPESSFPALSEDLRVDTAIVGGGITGITAATHLAEAGRTVALLEKDRVITKVTGHTTAKLTSKHGIVYDRLVSNFGEKKARQYAEANEAAIDEVETRVDERGIDCEFRRSPGYTYASSYRDRKTVKDEAKAAQRLGLPASYVDNVPLPFTDAPAVRFDDQAQFHPRKYLLALAEDLADAGHVFENTRVTDVTPGNPCRVTTNRGVVTADNVVVASHFPFIDRGFYFARMAPKRSYLLAARLSDPPPGMFYNTGSPYFSVRSYPDADDDLILIGGQSHETGQDGETTDRYRELASTARERFDIESIEYRWSTQDYTSVDGVPFIGKLGPTAENVYVGTGYGGWGMTNGTAAGGILADLVRGESNPWADVFDPMRFKPKASAKTFTSENVENTLRLVADRIRIPESGDRYSVSACEASVVRENGYPIGVYRDDEGEVHAVSAICPHMKCLVTWNDAEKSWDCPCHGSRFDCDGTVLDGPATRDLPRMD